MLLWSAAKRRRWRRNPCCASSLHVAAPSEPLEVASADHRRTFCHADDAEEMIGRAASSPAGHAATLNSWAPANPRSRSANSRSSSFTRLTSRAGSSHCLANPANPTRRCPDRRRRSRSPQIDLATSVRHLRLASKHVFDPTGPTARAVGGAEPIAPFGHDSKLPAGMAWRVIAHHAAVADAPGSRTKLLYKSLTARRAPARPAALQPTGLSRRKPVLRRRYAGARVGYGGLIHADGGPAVKG